MTRANQTKTYELLNEPHASTYSLLVRSEERKRAVFETVIYGLIFLSGVIAILQFTFQPDILPLSALPVSAGI
jgi:hypothetical protein